jgi:murein DD-endopeptidase MepM/ murein hydrolase activator NlpD
LEHISSSVGAWEQGATNTAKDVRAVQEMLEAAADRLDRSDIDPRGIDGKIARPPRQSDTVNAIKAFQKTFMKNPDGLVKPGSPTWNLLVLTVLMPSRSIVEPPPATSLMAGPCFPLAFVPKQDYHKSTNHKRWYGAPRKNGRWHAGCDLIAPVGTAIYAVDAGVVEMASDRGFVSGTRDDGTQFSVGVLAIKHDSGFWARYCEIKSLAKGVRKGTRVSKGQVVAYVGLMKKDHMLHFELYQGTATGDLGLTQRSSKPYQRRSDLIDPTPYLDAWKQNLPKG